MEEQQLTEIENPVLPGQGQVTARNAKNSWIHCDGEFLDSTRIKSEKRKQI